MAVVQLQTVHQGRLQVSPAVEAGLLQTFVDAHVEAFNHAIRLRVPWRCQEVFDRARVPAFLGPWRPYHVVHVVRVDAIHALLIAVSRAGFSTNCRSDEKLN